MNVLQLSQHLENYNSLAALTSANKREYCARHGYDFHEQVGNYNAMPFDYQRVALMYDIFNNNLLGKHYDAIHWVGCDTWVLNMTKTIEGFLEKYQKDYLIAFTLNHVNNDSVIIRNTPWSKRWLEFLLSVEPQYRNDCWYSQRAVIHNHQKPEWADGVAVLPPNEINAFFMDLHQWPVETEGHAKKGDFLLHLPGLELHQRIAVFQSQRVKDLMVYE
jgi:hypothetical protein